MNFTGIIKDPIFLSYTISAVVLLVAAGGTLLLLQRRGRRVDDFLRVFWTWVVMVAIIILAILLGKEVFALVVALVALFACKEFARATGLYDDWIFTGFVYLAIVAVNFVALQLGYDIFMASPIYVVAGLCLLPILRNRSEGMLQRVALSVMAFVYFGYFLAHLSLLATVTEDAAVGRMTWSGGANLDQALQAMNLAVQQAFGAAVRPGYVQDPYGYLFFVLYGTASADLVGWLAGRWLGRHPLAPRISTDMTWERAAASFAWGLLWSFTLGWTLPQPQFTWVAMLLSALLFGILGPLGELVMRYVLRDLGLKAPLEGSEFIPYLALGHLNRLIFVAPLFVRLVHWFDPGLFGPLGIR
jgi:predicted CDP-diglyceride synthetase/phosphatidate cytidylyltransferase